MSHSKRCVVVHSNDTCMRFIGMYKGPDGRMMTKWVAEYEDALVFFSVAEARRFIRDRLPNSLSPYCKVLSIPDMPLRYWLGMG